LSIIVHDSLLVEADLHLAGEVAVRELALTEALDELAGLD
jgi:hypothetical protein